MYQSSSCYFISSAGLNQLKLIKPLWWCGDVTCGFSLPRGLLLLKKKKSEISHDCWLSTWHSLAPNQTKPGAFRGFKGCGSFLVIISYASTGIFLRSQVVLSLTSYPCVVGYIDIDIDIKGGWGNESINTLNTNLGKDRTKNTFFLLTVARTSETPPPSSQTPPISYKNMHIKWWMTVFKFWLCRKLFQKL